MAALTTVFTESCGLLAGARAVGDPIAVLPVLFHLIWRQELSVGLKDGLLSPATPVRPAAVFAKEVGGDAEAAVAG
ncbi:hypothetical protein [Streptomyces sp. NPDC058751]|uniref:hypothetical protein n=1 Tax=Streptomyces sp. NPDC058751 TaxID=3346623 RepID=UPI00368DCD9C